MYGLCDFRLRFWLAELCAGLFGLLLVYLFFKPDIVFPLCLTGIFGFMFLVVMLIALNKYIKYFPQRPRTRPIFILFYYYIILVNSLGLLAIEYPGGYWLTALGLIALCLTHYLVAFVLSKLLKLFFRIFGKHRISKRYMLVISESGEAEKFIVSMDKYKDYGLSLKIISGSPEKPIAKKWNLKDLRSSSDLGREKEFENSWDLEKVLLNFPIDDIVFSQRSKEWNAFGRFFNICTVQGKRVHILLEKSVIKQELRAEELFGFPVISYFPINLRALNLGKRLFDLGFAILALLVLSPILMLITISIKLTSKGPVLFVQERLGYNNRRFPIYKFRTMLDNAEYLKEGIRHLNQVDGPVFKIENDPRITPIGRFLRKTSLDELPQLFNVILGDMSIVGPRPLPTSEGSQCNIWQYQRLSVKPGLTGLWQVSGRNRTNFNQWMEMDIEYIKNWSLLLDLRIILKTIPEVLGAKGM